MNEDEVRQLIASATLDMQKQQEAMTVEMNRYKQNGLDALLNRNLTYHSIPYETAVPTLRDKRGTPALVFTGGSYYVYYNVDGDTTWKGVILA